EDAVTRPDGGVVMFGVLRQSPNLRSPFAAAFSPSGGLEAGFATDGILDVDFENLGTPAGGAVLPDGRIVTALTGGHPVSGEAFRSQWQVAADGTSQTVVGLEADVASGFIDLAARPAGAGVVLATGDSELLDPVAASDLVYV